MTTKEIVTKFEIDKTDGMKTSEIIEALDRIGHDRETLEAKGVSPEEIDTVMSTLGTALTVKVSGAMNIMGKYLDLATAASVRAKAMREIADSYDRKVEQLRNYLKYAMSASGTKKIEAEHYTITYSKVQNGRVDIFDEAQIPADYKRTKVIVENDKTKIGDALKRGENVAGARMAESERLIIKGA